MSWTEPDHPGPDIADYDADYDLRYRIGGNSDEFTDAEYAGDQTSVTVTGLDAILTHVAPGSGYNDPIGGTARVAAQAEEVELWSAELTVGKSPSTNIYGYSAGNNYGSLSPTSFNQGGQAYTFTYIYISRGALNLGYSPVIPFTSLLTLIVDGESFPASAGTLTTSGGPLTWFDSGLTWATGDTVAVSLKATIPGAPTGFSATAGSGMVDLTWANPNDATITKYQYQQSTDGGSNWDPDWKDITDSEASTNSYEVTGLTGGTAYTFQVRAVNAAGPGDATDTVTATPAAANPAPAFATETATLEVAENTGLGGNVGAAVTATDPDTGDTLTYSLSGMDAALFTINGSTGQITVGSGTTLDYESSTRSYAVTVSVHDGKDSDGDADNTVDDTIPSPSM